MPKTRIIIHSGRFNNRSLYVTKADELKLMTMFSSKEVHGVLNVEVNEVAYKAIFKLEVK